MSLRAHDPDPGNLWLARALWDSGAVQFGSFNLGATLDSPIYVNPRRLIGNPRTLRRIGELLADETRTLTGMLHPHLSPFELVAGVPLGGLHLATAFSLTSDVPLIYVHRGRGPTIATRRSRGRTSRVRRCCWSTT